MHVNMSILSLLQLDVDDYSSFHTCTGTVHENTNVRDSRTFNEHFRTISLVQNLGNGQLRPCAYTAVLRNASCTFYPGTTPHRNQTDYFPK